MDKTGFITSISLATGYSRNISGSVLDAVLKILSAAMASGEKVVLDGFGSFESKERAPRVGRNLNTNTPVPIPARRVPLFRPYKRLKDAVAKGG